MQSLDKAFYFSNEFCLTELPTPDIRILITTIVVIIDIFLLGTETN